MWLLGHVASAILATESESGPEEADYRYAFLLGAVAPDLVDKPLGGRGVLPAYHTIGHSFVTATCLWFVGAASADERVEWFWRGVMIHLAGDLPLAFDKWDDPAFFFWPVSRPTNDVERPVAEYVRDYATSPWFLLELLLCVLAWQRR